MADGAADRGPPRREDALNILRNAVLIVFFVVLLVFTAANWGAFTAPQELRLLVRTVEAPLGLVMLGFIAVLTVLFVLYAASIRTSGLVEYRKYAKELEAARRLADDAEASRFTDLKGYLEAELASVGQTVVDEAATTRVQMTESSNTLQAYLGEIDDLLKSGGPDAAHRTAGDTAHGGGDDQGSLREDASGA